MNSKGFFEITAENVIAIESSTQFQHHYIKVVECVNERSGQQLYQ